MSVCYRVGVMDAVITAAGVLSLLLGVAHETLGVVWVLPRLSSDQFRPTPFGGARLTLAMVAATWHLITVFVFGIAAVLIVLGVSPEADATTVVLRVFGAAWITAAVVATAVALDRVRQFGNLFRFPVPIFFVIVGLLCWVASS